MAEKRKKEGCPQTRLLKQKPSPRKAMPHPFSKQYTKLQGAELVSEPSTDVVVRAVPYCSSRTPAAAVCIVSDCVIAEPFIDKFSTAVVLRYIHGSEYEFKSCRDAKQFLHCIGQETFARRLRDQILNANECLFHLDFYIRLANCIAVDLPHDGLTFDPRYMDFITFMKASVRFSLVHRYGYVQVSSGFFIPAHTLIEVHEKIIRAAAFLRKKYDTYDDKKYSLEYFTFRLVP